MDPVITRLTALVRENTDEPGTDARFTDAALLRRIEAAYQSVIMDLNSATDAPLLVQHPLDLEDGTDVYLLPPNVDTIWRIAMFEDGRARQEIRPLPVRHWHGPGFRLEGNTIRFEPPWQRGSETFLVEYLPNGDFLMHSGTASAATASTLTMAASPTLGALDTRANSYVGAVLRVLSDSNGYVQERLITAYDHTTRQATVSPNWDPIPSGTVLYEVVPQYGNLLEHVVAFHVAQDLAAVTGAERRFSLLTQRYAMAKRAVRQSLTRRENIVGDHFEREAPQSISTGGRPFQLA